MKDVDLTQANVIEPANYLNFEKQLVICHDLISNMILPTFRLGNNYHPIMAMGYHEK